MRRFETCQLPVGCQAHQRPPSELGDEELASVREDHMEDLGAPEWHGFDSEERYLGYVYAVRLRIVGDRGVGPT